MVTVAPSHLSHLSLVDRDHGMDSVVGETLYLKRVDFKVLHVGLPKKLSPDVEKKNVVKRLASSARWLTQASRSVVRTICGVGRYSNAGASSPSFFFCF